MYVVRDRRNDTLALRNYDSFENIIKNPFVKQNFKLPPSNAAVKYNDWLSEDPLFRKRVEVKTYVQVYTCPIA